MSVTVDAPGVTVDDPRRTVNGALIPKPPEGLAQRWQVETRDENLNRTGNITGWVDQLDLTLKFNGPSHFTISGGPELADRLPLNGGVVISRNRTAVLSGIVTEPAEESSGVRRDITVDGIDDLARLEGRLVLPDPTIPPDDPNQPDIDRQNGAAETVIKHYVTANAGTDAIAFTAPTPDGGTVNVDLRIPGLVVAADQARGATITGRGRYHQLLSYSALMGERGGLGLRAIADGTDILFDVYEPRDLSDLVKISVGFGNLRSWTRRIALPDVTVGVAGGRGEGADRLIRVMADPVAEVVGPRLRFLDQRNAGEEDDIPDQEAALDDALADALDGLDEDLTIDAQDTHQVKFGRDYTLGDQVTVVLGGQPIAKTITEVEVTVNKRGEQIRPSVGGSAERRWDLYERMAAVESRLADIARS